MDPNCLLPDTDLELMSKSTESCRIWGVVLCLYMSWSFLYPLIFLFTLEPMPTHTKQDMCVHDTWGKVGVGAEQGSWTKWGTSKDL